MWRTIRTYCFFKLIFAAELERRIIRARLRYIVLAHLRMLAASYIASYNYVGMYRYAHMHGTRARRRTWARAPGMHGPDENRIAIEG